MNAHLGELREMLAASLNGDPKIDRNDVIRRIGEALPTVEQWRQEIGEIPALASATPDYADVLLTVPSGEVAFDWGAAERDLMTGPLA